MGSASWWILSSVIFSFYLLNLYANFWTVSPWIKRVGGRLKNLQSNAIEIIKPGCVSSSLCFLMRSLLNAFMSLCIMFFLCLYRYVFLGGRGHVYVSRGSLFFRYLCRCFYLGGYVFRDMFTVCIDAYACFARKFTKECWWLLKQFSIILAVPGIFASKKKKKKILQSILTLNEVWARKESFLLLKHKEPNRW